LSKVAHELEKLVNAFHPASPTRLEFERDFRKKLTETTNKYWEEAIAEAFGPLPLPDPKGQKGTAQPRGEFKDMTTRKAARTMLGVLDSQSKADLSMEQFSNFFIYGDGSPEKLDDLVLNKLDRKVLATSLNVPFFSSFLTDDFQRERLTWQQNLVVAVDEVLEHDGLETIGLAETSRMLCLNELISWVDNFAKEQHHKDVESAKLARFFFRYLLEQVSSRTDADNLTKSIHALLKREKRANASYLDFVHACVTTAHVPVEETSFLFGDEINYPIGVPAYGALWTRAYFNIVKQRTSDDVFRLLAVDLINPLIFETIHYSLSLFKSGRVFREATKQIKYIQDLEKYRDIIVKASLKYGPPPKKPTVSRVEIE